MENEYGFCGDSKPYLRHLIATARATLGPDVILYTTDPPDRAIRGSIAGDEVYTYDMASVLLIFTSCLTLCMPRDQRHAAGAGGCDAMPTTKFMRRQQFVCMNVF